MSGIVGLFNRDGRPVERHLPGVMLGARPERGSDGTGVDFNGPAAIGHQLFALLPGDQAGQQPIVQGDILFAADCRLDNRPELSRSLGLDDVQAAKASDASLILAAYKRWGERCPERLLGDFAFIVWNGDRQQLFAARDPLGAHDLCYYVDGSLCLVASEVSHLLAHPAVEPQINEDRIAFLLAGLLPGPEETFHQGILYLPPAHALRVTAERVDLWRYWDVTPTTLRYRDEREYAEQYRDLLAEAVRCRLRVIGPVGISLSGGLDSTSLAALAAPMLPLITGQARLPSFSYAFDELESCDERVYIRPLAERYGLDTTWVFGDDRWAFKDLAAWPLTPDFVITDVFAELPLSVREAAGAAGIRALLAGYYGDVLMSGQFYWALDMVRHGRLGLLGRTTWANRDTINWHNTLFEYGLRRLIPPEISQPYRRIRPRKAETFAPGIHEALLERTDLASRLSPAPWPGRTPPAFRQRYDDLLNSGFNHTHITRHQYNAHGMEVLEPYYDRRLVEFVLAVPAYILGRPDSHRRLHREAMAGLLPEDVRLRPRRTTFTPLLRKGLTLEREKIRRLLAKPLIVERGYIRNDWLQSQLAKEYESSPDWWLLERSICLELWLQRYWN